MARKGSDYVAAPTVPVELEQRYQRMIGALAGVFSVAEAARQEGISRNRFQTLMHRGAAALLYEIQPHPAGRRPKPERERELEERVRVLERENAALQHSLEVSERLFSVASQMLKSRNPRTKAAKPAGKIMGEPDEEPHACLRQVEHLRATGVAPTLAACAVGRSARTVQRYAQRSRAGATLVERRGPAPGARPPMPEAKAKLEALVSQSHGLMGAAALARAVPGVSRRSCADLKAQILRELERSRRAAALHMAVTQPGIVRGFDAMHVGDAYLLVSADGAVPYRTSIFAAARYDSRTVAAALEHDFAQHGAPLVLRHDRAKSHLTAEVRAVLDAHQVLVLMGPPHYPGFYGQLERQNREHRQWLDAAQTDEPLASAASQMRHVFNELVPRRTLAWQTAGQAWRARMPLEVDRAALKAEVVDRAQRMRRGGSDAPSDVVARLAIEVTLSRRGLLNRESGTWC
jgi:hypothetical protein